MTHVHFIGIGGSGLSAIARLLLEQGYSVSGSDRSLSPLAQSLQQEGVRITIGHSPDNITEADWVIRSSAIPDDNVEVQAALKAGLPVYKRADFLGRLMAPPEKDGIAIAGTHGKTTTTAMIAWMLHALGADPSFIIGGVSQNLKVNAKAGQGRTFVIEADEYDRMFLGLQPRYAVITNIEHDHPDIYPTPADFIDAFRQFIGLIPDNGALIINAEDPISLILVQEPSSKGKRIITYSIDGPSLPNQSEHIIAKNIRPNAIGGFTFSVFASIAGNSDQIGEICLSVPGLHNVRNALSALAIGKLFGYSLAEAASVLENFAGTGRRFEIKGVVNDITVIDDYAHHPTEIRATLAAARARYPSKRIWAVWQPHTYSRTQTLFEDFIASFDNADQVIVSEIYAAREAKQEFSSRLLVEALTHNNARFIGPLGDITNYLHDHLMPGDVLIVMSAGDADQISTDVIARLRRA